MAIFTGTPVTTVGSPYLWCKDLGSMNGPWHVGGAMYITGLQQSFDDVSVAKSTDGGLTWTAFPNADPDGGFQNMEERADAIFDPTTGEIRWIVSDSSFKMCTVAFDTATDTWGPKVDSGIDVFDPLRIGIRPSGAIRAIYSFFSGGINHLKYIPIVGGVFGAPGDVDPGIGTEYLMVRGVISDASGTLWIPYRDVTGSVLYVNSLDSGDNPGTRTLVDSGGGTYTLGNGIVSTTLDSIIFAWGFGNSSSDALPARFLQGTPIAAPVWTVHSLNTPVSGLFTHEVSVIDCGATVKFLFASSNNTFITPPGPILTIEQVIYDGSTVGAQATYWDIVANPPTGATNLTTDGISGILNGSTLEIVVTTVIDTSNDLSAVFLGGVLRINRMY